MERMIFWKILKGNAYIKTPFDSMGEILGFMESNGEDIVLLRDVCLMILGNFSYNFHAFNSNPAKVAGSVIYLARKLMSQS